MIKHRIFVKGETIYVLLSSNSLPNILIPVKAVVKEVKHDDVNPQYLIKIIKFYDNLHFIRRYLFNMSFSSAFNKRARRFNLQANRFKNTKHLLEEMEKYKYYFVVDSIMCTKYRLEMQQLFNKIQDHLIHNHFKELRHLMTRIFYSGSYRVRSIEDFNTRLRNGFKDLIVKTGFTLKKFFELF